MIIGIIVYAIALLFGLVYLVRVIKSNKIDTCDLDSEQEINKVDRNANNSID